MIVCFTDGENGRTSRIELPGKNKEGKMFNHVMWQVNKERHSDLLKVAEAHRLVKQESIEGFSRKDQFIMNVGEFLVAVGLRLRARYEPAMQAH